MKVSVCGYTDSRWGVGEYVTVQPSVKRKAVRIYNAAWAKVWLAAFCYKKYSAKGLD